MLSLRSTDGAALPGLRIKSPRNYSSKFLVYVVVALSVISKLQVAYSFSWPRPRHSNDLFITSQSTPLGRRDDAQEPSTGDAVWDNITPSKELRWHECYDEFRCARLEVPLDYWNGTEGTVILGISMLPAKVPITDSRYGGPVLTNPGGPGVSGSLFVRNTATLLKSFIEPPGSPSLNNSSDDIRYFDIVGIDPRGVGQSLPKASCFETDLQRAEWELRLAAAGIPGSSNVAVADSWGRRRAFSHACGRFSASLPQEENVQPFITTASMARDMVTFIDRFAEWREAEAQRILEGKQVPERLQNKQGQEKVQFLGYSWGSFLGMTFASMFPERTGRFVLDAIVDTDDYINALWTVSVLDSEKAVDWFYSSCAEAGPPGCALAATPNSTAAAIRSRVNSILETLYRNPIITEGLLPDLLTWSDIMTVVMTSLIAPTAWPVLAQTLVAVENTTSSPLVATFTPNNYPNCSLIPEPFLLFDAEAAIICQDAFPVDQSFSLQDAESHWEKLVGISPTMAATFAPLRFTCASWQTRAKYSYQGPFGAGPDAGVPPMLFIGNSVDPVSPIRSARKMAARFSGARLLTNDMPGHSSLAGPSSCMIRNVRAYMQMGMLPEEGTVCGMDGPLFGTSEGGS